MSLRRVILVSALVASSWQCVLAQSPARSEMPLGSLQLGDTRLIDIPVAEPDSQIDSSCGCVQILPAEPLRKAARNALVRAERVGALRAELTLTDGGKRRIIVVTGVVSDPLEKSYLSPVEALARRKSILVDVRPLADFRACRAAGAISMPLPVLSTNLRTLGMDVTVIGDGFDGALAQVIRDIPNRPAGFRLVKGGMPAWVEAGLPLDGIPRAADRRQLTPLEVSHAVYRGVRWIYLVAKPVKPAIRNVPGLEVMELEGGAKLAQSIRARLATSGSAELLLSRGLPAFDTRGLPTPFILDGEPEQLFALLQAPPSQVVMRTSASAPTSSRSGLSPSCGTCPQR